MAKKSSKTGRIILVLFIIALVFAYFTNPPLQSHKDALKTKANAIMSEIVSERNDALSAGIWQTAGSRLLNGFIDSSTSVDNYWIFSLTKFQWDGKSYPVGIGAFGKVYITKELNKDVIQPIIKDMEDKINDSLPDFLKKLV